MAPNISHTPSEISVRVGEIETIEFYVNDENHNINISSISIQAHPDGQTSNIESLPYIEVFGDTGLLKLKWTPDSLDITGFKVVVTDSFGLSFTWIPFIKVCDCSAEYEDCTFSDNEEIGGMNLFLSFLFCNLFCFKL